MAISCLLLAGALKTLACSPWYYDPQTYLMYRSYVRPSDRWAANPSALENCLLWQEQCGTSASVDDIYEIVYLTSLDDLRAILRHKGAGRKIAKSNPFAAALWKDREAVELLVLAKECEASRAELNSPWYYPASRDERPFGLDDIARKAGEYEGSRFAGRYALQRIRALFSLKDYDECINYWNDVACRLNDDVVKQMAERYVAGAFFRTGDTERAKECYIRLGAINDLYYCFKDDATPWEETMYEYAPDCKELRDWTAARIKEEDLAFYESWDDLWKKGSVGPEKAAILDDLAAFCGRIAAGGRVSDPDFWYYSQAYLRFLTGKRPEAVALLSKAETSPGSQEMKDNIRVFRLYLDSVTKPWSSSYEKDMVAGLEWLDGMIVSHIDEGRGETMRYGIYKMGINLSYFYWNDMMRKIVLSAVVPKLLANRREISAIRFANMADNRLLNLVDRTVMTTYDDNKKEWVELEMTMGDLRRGKRFNSHDYSNALFQLIDTLDVVHLEAYVKSLDSPSSKEERFLDSRGYTERSFFHEVIGTKHIREMQYAQAVRWLSMLPKGFQSRLNTCREGYLCLDPFAQSRVKLKDNSEYKLSFARRMAELEKAMSSLEDPDERARNTVLYASGIRNSVSMCWAMSFYRKSVVDYDYEYFGETYFVRKQKAAFDRSEELFKRALQNCRGRETAADILYLLGNMRTVVERYPDTRAAAQIKGQCDKLVDYHLERRAHYADRAGEGPYEFEAKAVQTIR